MNAIQPSRPPLQPTPKRQVVPRPKRHLRQRSYQVMALETTAKIGVNIVISAAAVSALIQLLPYHWSRQAKLQEISTEVRQLEARVNSLNTEFSRNFDPRQAKSIMQEQGYRFDPNQRQIMLIKPKAVEVEQVESSP
ncbi:hypothetical protein BLD44_007320 [Mastigocladus laminosus UU774]|nr:MAG: hypothetical protein C6Y22_04530 [Hapalosiphonaceae cyanobacterium JJU2]TBR58402.1 hypothetical protein B4U84_21020 [Westiellopsis prolifica IICB1]TFI54805.1 hypothetical protein BLD44_007320 [Mastigocladus laminosus UU774]